MAAATSSNHEEARPTKRAYILRTQLSTCFSVFGDAVALLNIADQLHAATSYRGEIVVSEFAPLL